MLATSLRSVCCSLGPCLIGFCVLSSSVQAVCGPTTTEITIEPECFGIGDIVTATIHLVNADNLILGGQFFVSYNPSVFSVMSVQPGDDPFNFSLFTNTSVPGKVDYSVVIFPPGGMGSSADARMAVIEFLVIGEVGEPYVRFRLNDPPSPNQLLVLGGGLVPLMRFPGSEVRTLRDYADFQSCFSGFAVMSRDECRCLLDADEDDDLDEFDFYVFAQLLSDPVEVDCE